MKNNGLTQDYVRECFDYNPGSGKFTWRWRPRHHFPSHLGYISTNRRMAGTVAGLKSRHKGYPAVTLLGKKLSLHRVAFLYMNGDWPSGEVDHINRNREDNRWKNLRVVSPSENQRNRGKQSNNTSGHTGVVFYKRDQKWRAQIKSRGRCYHLGYFDEFDDAIRARKAAEARLGFHPNHGT